MPIVNFILNDNNIELTIYTQKGWIVPWVSPPKISIFVLFINYVVKILIAM